MGLGFVPLCLTRAVGADGQKIRRRVLSPCFGPVWLNTILWVQTQTSQLANNSRWEDLLWCLFVSSTQMRVLGNKFQSKDLSPQNVKFILSYIFCTALCTTRALKQFELVQMEQGNILYHAAIKIAASFPLQETKRISSVAFSRKTESGILN